MEGSSLEGCRLELFKQRLKAPLGDDVVVDSPALTKEGGLGLDDHRVDPAGGFCATCQLQRIHHPKALNTP